MSDLFRSLWLSVLMWLAPVSSAAADVLVKTASIDGLTLQYKVVLPKAFDPAKAYPAILAFPPSGQNIRTLAGAGAARLFDQFDAARTGTCAKG
jgi:hypothetical protein